MRLPFRFWSSLYICLAIIFACYVFCRLPSGQRKSASKHVDLDISMTILGQDDRTRRKSNTEKQIVASKLTCNIPKLEMDAPEVVHFFQPHKEMKCSNRKNWVYLDEEKKVRLTEESKSAKCYVQQILFGSMKEGGYKLGDFIDLKIGEELPFEMNNVKCILEHEKWELPFLTIKKVEKPKPKDEKKQWNVLMMSFDSLSQMTFRRKLPKTVQVLERMGAIVLNGYNIVGDGTPQAFIPITTGATEEELPLTRKRYADASFVDEVYPYIWNNFSAAGYATLLAEDEALYDTYSYRLKGFKNQPTDHLFRPYIAKLENQLWKYVVDCIGSDLQHTHWLRTAREFAETYRSSPHFGLFHHAVYSHDDINQVGIMDADFASWLKSMNQDGLFDNTILIVMADHGHRFAKLRETHQGQLEERLPFFSFTLPKKMLETTEGKQIHANLLLNKDRLSSPFDIHQTLLDIINPPADFTEEQPLTSRSLSLFRPIPFSRNCDQAGIEAHWCTCLDWKDALNTEEDRKISTHIAEGIVEAFNRQLKNELKICSPLKLKSIEYAKKLIPKEALMKYKNVKDQDGFVADLTGNTETSNAHYQIKLATSPGRGIYEATVLFDFLTSHLTIDLGAISHVSAYGDDPHCIIDRNYFLASYCVCYDRI